MKIIIGLGNPGKKYEKNRHNAGHMLAEFLISNFKFLNNFQIKKTNVFMNDSGKFVKKAVSGKRLAVSDLYIAHDDLDLKLGTYKIQLGKGPKCHYGVESVERELGTKEFWRIRIGIDNRPHFAKASRGEEYVLEDFTEEELAVLNKVFGEIYAELKKCFNED